VRKLISIQARNKEVGENSRRKCIFHVCVEQPIAGGFQPNLTNVSSLYLERFQWCEVLEFLRCRGKPGDPYHAVMHCLAVGNVTHFT